MSNIVTITVEMTPEDYAKWQSLGNQSLWLHQHLNSSNNAPGLISKVDTPYPIGPTGSPGATFFPRFGGKNAIHVDATSRQVESIPQPVMKDTED